MDRLRLKYPASGSCGLLMIASLFYLLLLQPAYASDPRQVVVLSASREPPQYLFYLPFTVLLWKRIVGYDPLVLITFEKEHMEPVTQLVIGEVVKQQGNVTLVHVDKIPCQTVSTIAQASRLYSSFLPGFGPHDRIMMGDADLFPLKREPWVQSDNERPCFIANDAYRNLGLPREQMQIPFVGIMMNVSVWRFVLGGPYRRTTFLGGEFEEILADELTKGEDYYGPQLWPTVDRVFDQLWVARWLQETGFYPSKCESRVRNTADDRLDRINWNFDLEKLARGGYADAHLFKDGHTGESWQRTLELLDGVFSVFFDEEEEQRLRDWARSYHDEFTKSLEYALPPTMQTEVDFSCRSRIARYPPS